MKKYYALAIFGIMSLLISCGENEDQDPTPKNDLINTIWEAPDEIAQMIWGGNNVQQYEFINETEVQHLKIRNGGVRDTEKGSYSIDGNIVTVVMEDKTSTLERSGSIMTANNQGSISGAKVIYSLKK